LKSWPFSRLAFFLLSIRVKSERQEGNKMSISAKSNEIVNINTDALPGRKVLSCCGCSVFLCCGHEAFDEARVVPGLPHDLATDHPGLRGGIFEGGSAFRFDPIDLSTILSFFPFSGKTNHMPNEAKRQPMIETL
jgi:hypothetical protein